MPLRKLNKNQQQINDLKILPINVEHTLTLDKLPLNHKDPLDRLLIAQSKKENLILLSKDNIFKKYPVKVIW